MSINGAAKSDASYLTAPLSIPASGEIGIGPRDYPALHLSKILYTLVLHIPIAAFKNLALGIERISSGSCYPVVVYSKFKPSIPDFFSLP